MAPSTMISTPLEKLVDDCIRVCTECHRVAIETLNHCLRLGGAHADPNHIRSMLDTIERCQTTADFIIRGSEFHARECALCAEVCALCADSCAETGGDPQMKACEDACRRCAETCRAMVTARAA
jgi:hypothetical protein